MLMYICVYIGSIVSHFDMFNTSLFVGYTCTVNYKLPFSVFKFCQIDLTMIKVIFVVVQMTVYIDSGYIIPVPFT